MLGIKKFLTPNKPAKPFDAQKIYGFDIETAGNNNEFVLGCITHNGVTHSFSCARTLLDFIRSYSMRNTTLVATNMAFDTFGVLLKTSALTTNISYTLHNKRYSRPIVSLRERNGHIYRITIRSKSGKDYVKIVDTLNIFPASVAQLGELLSIPKLPHPACFKRFPKTDQERQELLKYCANDAHISEQFFKQVVLPYCHQKQIPLKDTAASLAMACFRTHYLKEVIPVEDAQTHKLCFQAYYGGRTEVFKRGMFTNIACYDVNSLYPFVSTKEFPDPRSGHYNTKISLYALQHHEGVCFARVHIPTHHHKGCLPYRLKGRLVFPVGTIEGYWCFPELRNALKEGATILALGEGVVYTKTQTFFKEYILDTFQERLHYQHEHNPLEKMSKLFMNSLYGKWGFNYRESSQVIKPEELTKQLLSKAVHIQPYKHFMVVQTYDESDPPAYAFPIWAAYTTCYARLHMWGYIKERDVCYMDTDSLFIDQNISFSTSEHLGALKLEYTTQHALFIRPKFYKTDKKIKCKGMPKLTNAELTHILTTPEIPLLRERFVKLRQSLRAKHAINSIIHVPKTFDVEDKKRVWHQPFSLEPQESLPLVCDDGKSMY